MLRTQKTHQIVFEFRRKYVPALLEVVQVYRHLRYPERARKKEIEGMVLVSFDVTKQGKTQNFKIVKGLGYGCDKAAIKAIKSVWFKPGKVNGQPVDVTYTWPINFRL